MLHALQQLATSTSGKANADCPDIAAAAFADAVTARRVGTAVHPLTRRSPPAAARGHRGFTLVELMLTLVVAVVLITIAVPSFRSITLSSKLTSTANDMVASIQTARLEAIKRNANVQVCSNVVANNGGDALGTACGTDAGAVYVESGQVRAGPTIPASLKISGGMTALRFSAQGLGYEVGDSSPAGVTVVDICTTGMKTNNHRLIKIAAGSVVTITPTSGNCT